MRSNAPTPSCRAAPPRRLQPSLFRASIVPPIPTRAASEFSGPSHPRSRRRPLPVDRTAPRRPWTVAGFQYGPDGVRPAPAVYTPRMPDGNRGGICVGTASTPSEPSFSLLRIEKDDLPPFPMTSPHPWRNGPPPFLSSSPGGKERTAFLSSSPALHGESEPRQGGWLKDSFCPTVTGRKMRRCCGARWRCRRRRRVRFRLLSVASGTVPRPARRNHLRGGLSVEGSDTHASP